jgi:hypothetical protein
LWLLWRVRRAHYKTRYEALLSRKDTEFELTSDEKMRETENKTELFYKKINEEPTLEKHKDTSTKWPTAVRQALSKARELVKQLWPDEDVSSFDRADVTFYETSKQASSPTELLSIKQLQSNKKNVLNPKRVKIVFTLYKDGMATRDVLVYNEDGLLVCGHVSIRSGDVLVMAGGLTRAVSGVQGLTDAQHPECVQITVSESSEYDPPVDHRSYMERAYRAIHIKNGNLVDLGLVP